MSTTDAIDDNLSLAYDAEQTDQINSHFYSEFPYPWRPRSIDCVADPDFWRVMLNQNLGDWTHSTVPPNPQIWVAGCGTNQAAITALNFPTASVLGSDISPGSLELCAATQKDLGCTNLELRQESINHVNYDESFDYVICTGVIHHNAEPELTLDRIAKALKPTGVLELMVYNRYHRILTSAFQKAVRLLANDSAIDFQKELSITRKLMDSLPGEGLMRQFAAGLKNAPEMVIADSLMQPVENSYTVEVLEQMARRCGLEFMAATPSVWDRGHGNVGWNMRFPHPEIQEMYNKLPDSRRWQITNLLLCENSPMLWFYFRRRENPAGPRTEQEICSSFLNTKFRANEVARSCYLLTHENRFKEMKSPVPYPGLPAKPDLRRIVEAVNEGAPMERVLASQRISLDFNCVNDLRLQLTTTASPFLRATA